jgi:hypothetical protein
VDLEILGPDQSATRRLVNLSRAATRDPSGRRNGRFVKVSDGTIRASFLSNRSAFPMDSRFVVWCNAVLVGVTLGVTMIFEKQKSLHHNRFQHLFD